VLNWRRGITRLYAVLATAWCVGFGGWVLLDSTSLHPSRYEAELGTVVGILFLTFGAPLLGYALLRAVFWAVDGFR
jgi:hypothetical protein